MLRYAIKANDGLIKDLKSKYKFLTKENYVGFLEDRQKFKRIYSIWS